MKGDDVPDENAPVTRCIPSQLITFSKSEKTLATVGLDCNQDATGLVVGRFQSAEPKISGGVQIDAGAFFDVVKSLSRF